MNIFDKGYGNNFGLFYAPKGESVLGNYYEKILYIPDWGIFDSAEHAYQFCKFPGNEPTFNALYKTNRMIHNSGDSAKKAAQTLEKQGLIRPNWKNDNVRYMKRILQCKFAPLTYELKLLRSTEGMYLAEHTNKDSFWGDGGNGTGQNMLGKLLMEIREDVINRPKEYDDYVGGRAGKHAVANICQHPGCDRPVYVDRSGKYSNACSRRHRDAIGAHKCQIPGCNRPVYVDNTGKYSNTCSISHRDAISAPKCQIPGCDRPVYVDPQTGKKSPACSISHRNIILQAHKCKQIGCNKPAWFDSKKGTYSTACSKKHL